MVLLSLFISFQLPLGFLLAYRFPSIPITEGQPTAQEVTRWGQDTPKNIRVLMSYFPEEDFTVINLGCISPCPIHFHSFHSISLCRGRDRGAPLGGNPFPPYPFPFPPIPSPSPSPLSLPLPPVHTHPHTHTHAHTHAWYTRVRECVGSACVMWVCMDGEGIGGRGR